MGREASQRHRYLYRWQFIGHARANDACVEAAAAGLLVLTVPAALTALLYWATGALLAATNRVIDPEFVRLAAVLEFVAFSFVAVLEARDRWSR